MTRWGGDRVAVTSRLVLRTFREDDLPLYAALNADPQVYAWLGGRPVPREESDAIAAWAQDLYDAEGIGLLAVERRDDAQLLGMCGLHHQESYPDDVEVAWRLAPAHWGQGYAAEAAEQWLRIGFDEHGLDRIISITEPDNQRSLAVMRRLGMAFDHNAEVTDEGETFAAVVHVLTAARWQQRLHREH